MEKYKNNNDQPVTAHETGEFDDTEQQQIVRLYEEIEAAGGMVREFRMPKGFLAAVGDIQDFRHALGLSPDDETTEITRDMIDGLPPMLLFAYPGSGETRPEAIRDGLKGWQASIETQASGRILHGSFSIGGGTMSAYMPANANCPQQWTIEYIRDGKVEFTEHVEMIYAPVFGPDAEDVNTLNERIEAIIVERSLE